MKALDVCVCHASLIPRYEWLPAFDGEFYSGWAYPITNHGNPWYMYMYMYSEAEASCFPD